MSTRSTASSTTTGSSSERARLVIMSSSLVHLILKTFFRDFSTSVFRVYLFSLFRYCYKLSRIYHSHL